jgi:hypothetical protein
METNPSWRELSQLVVKSLWREMAAAWLLVATGLAALWAM